MKMKLTGKCAALLMLGVAGLTPVACGRAGPVAAPYEAKDLSAFVPLTADEIGFSKAENLETAANRLEKFLGVPAELETRASHHVDLSSSDDGKSGYVHIAYRRIPEGSVSDIELWAGFDVSGGGAVLKQAGVRYQCHGAVDAESWTKNRCS